AYRILRDNPGDAKARKYAEEVLEMALGRPGSKARFLPQKDRVPTCPDGQTSSGLLAGKIRVEPDGRLLLKPHLELLPQDYLRVGLEDEHWHCTLPVTRRVPKAGTLLLRLPRHKSPKAGTPVYLIDRRQPELMQLLRQWQARLEALPGRPSRQVESSPRLPRACKARPRPDMLLRASLPQGRETRGSRKQLTALWLGPRSADISRTVAPRMAWWLPPMLWPDEEDTFRRMVARLWREGARHFVCNAPWQRGLFPRELPGDADLLAGPFCNIANGPALNILVDMGFAGAFVSPELAREDMLALPQQSPLPLGVVLSGFWPVGLSRFGLLGIKANEPFISPKGEVFWSRQYGGNVWLYPAWPVDLSEKRQELLAAGYSFFAHIQENLPPFLPEARRPGLFNWDGTLL
ncbi:MAG: U32 family peptidase, partial [Desulfovibrionaceae bacterium]|nr:U32 family peptidase [Desulfovibrionaceae bacterium]